MSENRPLDPHSFELLLAWLGDDRESAGERYERIRAKLVRIFAARGCTPAEDLADATIDRVMGKVVEIAPGYVGAPEAYFYRVAHFLYYEHLRRARRTPSLAAPEPAGDREGEALCLEECLASLASADRDLVRAYYQDEKRRRIEHRQQLAAALGIGPNALRIRLHRIRLDLRACLAQCLARLES